MHWGAFVLGAVICWGSYGPALHAGQKLLGSPVRALLWVGVAYFLVAVLIPGYMLITHPEPGQLTLRGSATATFAGLLGAFGAVCIIFAFKSGASPIYVMPLVFGGAPIINAVISVIQHPPKNPPSVWFYVGMILASLGAFLVLRFKPA